MAKAQLSIVISIVILSGWAMAQAGSDQNIEFTTVPPCGAGANSRGDIAGNVSGLKSPNRYKVVLYAHTDRWYVQPMASNPFTDVDGGGKWSNWTHLGHRYAALVVQSTFKPPSSTDTLPSGNQVILSAETESSSKCN